MRGNLISSFFLTPHLSVINSFITSELNFVVIVSFASVFFRRKLLLKIFLVDIPVLISQRSISIYDTNMTSAAICLTVILFLIAQ